MLTLCRASDTTDATHDDLDAATGSERRRGLRVRQARPVKVFEPMACRYFGGQTCDVSATGLRLELPVGASVRVGQTLSVHVGVNDGGQPLANRRGMMPARVVWLKRSAEVRGRMEAGVEFAAAIAAHLDAA
jgi:hypothetical protein